MVIGQSMEFYNNKNKECGICEKLTMIPNLNARAECSKNKNFENRLPLQLRPKPFKPPTAVGKNRLLCGPTFYKYSSGISDTDFNVEQDHLGEHGFLDSPCRKPQNISFVLPRPSSLYFINSESHSVLSRPSKFYLKPQTEDVEFIDDVLPGRSKLSFDDQGDGVLPNQLEPRLELELNNDSPTSSTDLGISEMHDSICYMDEIAFEKPKKLPRIIDYFEKTSEHKARYFENKNKIVNNSVSTTPPQATTPEPEEKNEKVFNRVSVKKIIAQWEGKQNIKPTESSLKKVNFSENLKIINKLKKEKKEKFKKNEEEKLTCEKRQEQEIEKNEEKKSIGKKDRRLKNIIALFEEKLKEKKEKNTIKEKPKKLNKLLVQWEEKSKIKPDSSLKEVSCSENSNVNKLRKINEEKLKKEKKEKLKIEELKNFKNEQEIYQFMKIFGKKRQGDISEDLLKNQKRFKKMTEEEKKILKNTTETVQTLTRLHFKSQMYKVKLLNQQKFSELENKKDDDKIETIKLNGLNNKRKIDAQKPSYVGTQPKTSQYWIESDHEMSSLFDPLNGEEMNNNEFESYQITVAEFAMLNDKYTRCEKRVKYSEGRFYNNYKNNDNSHYHF